MTSRRRSPEHDAAGSRDAHPFDWKVLESEHVVRDRWLSLRADTCQLPSGKVLTPYYVLEFPDWVNIVALTEEQDVVLVRQYRHGVRRTLLELPSGIVEAADRTPEAAIQRELLEETGHASEKLIETGRLSPNPANHVNLTHCFLATGVVRVAEPQGDDTEQLETVLVPLDEVVSMARQGGLLQALHVASLFLALQALEAGRSR